MDWNLKASPVWDFTELPPQETTLLDGSTSASSPQRDFSVDLKLGQVSNGAVVVSKDREKVSGPTKRARGTTVNNVVCQAAFSCLVDGCYADLSNSREYHRRHKVCELHSKTPVVTIGGHKQRFCQQCSRFHSLEEFDEGRRSCRKRLEGHNRRRRKPQPDPLIRPPPVNCFSSYQGTSRVSSRNFNHQIYSSTAAVGNQWFGGVNHPEAAAPLYYQQTHCFHNIPTTLLSSSHSAMFGGEEKSFALLQGSRQTLPPSREVSLLSGSGSSSNHHEGLSLQVQQEDTDCALSLLSSLSPQMMQPPPPPPLPLGIHQGTSSSSSSSATSTHCTFLFDDHFLPQTLPFHWD